MFPKVRDLRFFESKLWPCSCFGEVDAQYILPGTPECPLTATKVNDFEFQTTSMEGYWEDAYEGLLMTHK